MSMPHLNFLDIWGSSFKSFKKVSNLKLNLKSKIEDCRFQQNFSYNLQSSIFDLRLSFKFETFLKLLKLLPQMSKKFRCGMDI